MHEHLVMQIVRTLACHTDPFPSTVVVRLAWVAETAVPGRTACVGGGHGL